MSYSEIIKNSIEEFFKETNWFYEFREQYGYFQTLVPLKGKMKSCCIYIDIYDNGYNVYGVPHLKADESNMQAMAECLHRLNLFDDVNQGSFELDFNDGEFRFKTFVNCGDDCSLMPTGEMLHRSIELPAVMIDRYTDILLKVLFGFMKPSEVLEEAKKTGEDNI